MIIFQFVILFVISAFLAAFGNMWGPALFISILLFLCLLWHTVSYTHIFKFMIDIVKYNFYFEFKNESGFNIEVLFLLSDQSSASPTQAAATFKTDFTELFQSLCTALRDDQSTLLLYLLIHRNVNMKAFILSRTNIDALVSML